MKESQNLTSPSGIAKAEKKAIVRPFPLLQDLFKFAQKEGIHDAGFRYQGERADVVTAELPETFQPLTEDFPAKYFVVAYEDRRGEYYAEGTRHQLVRLSTVERPSSTDARTREMDLILPDDKRADRIRVTVREAVKEKSFEEINQKNDDGLDQPHGSARYTYEIDASGKRHPKKFEFDRLDEGLFDLGGDNYKPVRWVRDLLIEKGEDGEDQIQYNDLYILNRSNNPGDESRASVQTSLIGTFESPRSVVVEIGFGPMETARVLFHDEEKNITLFLHQSVRTEDSIAILKDDPVYTELLNASPKPEAFIEKIRARCQMLKDDWANPQSVYDDSPVIAERPLVIAQDESAVE
mgnify:CR=1 FL=1